MPSSPAPRRPEPDRPDPEPPRPKFRHVTPAEEAPGEVIEHGHGSGCVPVILIHFSLLALVIWLACVIGGFLLSGRLDHHQGAPVPGTHEGR